MKTKTTISYIILKYDKVTDNIFTKTTNNTQGIYKKPFFEYKSESGHSLSVMRDFITTRLLDFNTFVNDDHIFIPFVGTTTVGDTRIYNYLAIVFEADDTHFSSANYESWHKVKYNKEKNVWSLAWESGLSEPVNYLIQGSKDDHYLANPNMKSETIDFANAMQYVIEQTKEFPILGLLSGKEFTLKEVLHYQDLLGIEALKAGNDATFETQYENSIQVINNGTVQTSYKIKNQYLQK